jgi:hypothetical protein
MAIWIAFKILCSVINLLCQINAFGQVNIFDNTVSFVKGKKKRDYFPFTKSIEF